ncbi:hypothetical protein [Haloarcula sp. S1AR25-4]|nr:hypothetical protein [Halomicroarcula sp. S1AR25-4]
MSSVIEPDHSRSHTGLVLLAAFALLMGAAVVAGWLLVQWGAL